MARERLKDLRAQRRGTPLDFFGEKVFLKGPRRGKSSEVAYESVVEIRIIDLSVSIQQARETGRRRESKPEV